MLLVDTLLRIKILEEIGQEGRNSKVFKAYDPQLDAHLVVKKIPKADFINVNDYFAEAQMLYATAHPNIMGVKYASQDKDNVYLTMEFFKNGSLNTMLNKRNLFVKEVIKYSLEFLSGLHFMHTKKLVHFDIKPTNILLNDAGKAVITDFGLTKYLNERGFAYPDKLYELHAPLEAFDNSFGGFSVYTDIYHAGLTMYRMCNGNNYLREQYNKLNINTPEKLADAVKNELFPKRDDFLPHIPVKLRNVIKKSLSNDPSKRYETVLDMINDISLIDENLDWYYNIDANGYSEFVKQHESDTYTYKILIVNKNDNEWITKGIRVRNSDKKQNNVTKWNSEGYTNKKDALQALEKLLAL